MRVAARPTVRSVASTTHHFRSARASRRVALWVVPLDMITLRNLEKVRGAF